MSQTPVPLSPIMRQVQARFDEPLIEVIPRMFDEIGTVSGVADKLTISVNTLKRFAELNGYEIVATARWVKKSGKGKSA